MNLHCKLVPVQYQEYEYGLLRINFTRIFKDFQIAFVASRLGQFCENFENTCEIYP